MPIQPIQYQPTTQFTPVSNVLAVMKMKQGMDAAKEQLESAKMQNRLYAMQLKEAETGKSFNDELAKSLMQPQNVKDVKLTAPAQPGKTPIQGPGGVLRPGQGSPSGGINENTPRVPLASPEQTMQMTGIPADQVNAGALNRPGVIADITERQIVPLIEQGKQFGLSEGLIRSNPAAAYKHIQAKTAEKQAVLEKKIGMVQKLAQVNPKAAESVWNSDPQLSKLGAFGEQGQTEILDANGKVVGYKIPTGNGNYTVKMTNENSGGKTPFLLFKSGYLEDHPEAGDTEIGEAWKQNLLDIEEGKLKLKGEYNKSFSTWTAEEKLPYFEANLAQGKPTVKFAFGDRQSWNQYELEFGRFLVEHGFSGADLAVKEATYNSLKQSLVQQQKNIGAMGGYVRNINKQINRIDDLVKGGDEAGKAFTDRFGVRAFDIPVRELKMKCVGNADEVILEAYMIEISNEIGKLSGGGVQSVRELSVEAQARWMKIHDPNLSLRDNLKKVLQETKHMGEIRMEGAEQEVFYTQDVIRDLGKAGPRKTAERDDRKKDSGKSLPVF